MNHFIDIICNIQFQFVWTNIQVFDYRELIHTQALSNIWYMSWSPFLKSGKFCIQNTSGLKDFKEGNVDICYLTYCFIFLYSVLYLSIKLTLLNTSIPKLQSSADTSSSIFWHSALMIQSIFSKQVGPRVHSDCIITSFEKQKVMPNSFCRLRGQLLGVQHSINIC